MESLEARVLQLLEREGVVEAGETLLVGVSGGPDSVCLLHVLSELRQTLGVRLHVAHLDHMLRGVDSAADALYVSRLAERLGVPATVQTRDVETYRKEKRLSLEQAAREVRYDFYCDAAQSVGARRIALGHTEDDQVETILMHVMRGTGLTGLRGMRPVTRWQGRGGTLWLLRPLLEITRVETEEYCRAHGLEPRRDMSNYSPAFLRNRIRHEVIPLLQSCDRSIAGALLRTARAAADDLSFLDGQVTAAWGEVVTVQPNGILLNTSGLLSLHPSLQRHLLRRVLGEILGDLADIHAVHIEVMMDALTKQAGKKLTLPRGLAFLVGYKTCLVTRKGDEVCPLPPLEGEHPLNVPGDTVVAGWTARARITTPGSLAEGFKACLDFDRVGADLAVRGRRAGDRFQPLGMAEPKKLQDFMVDAKVPREWRDRVPLVCSTYGVVWVVGWRIAEWVKVTDATKQVLCLEFERSK